MSAVWGTSLQGLGLGLPSQILASPAASILLPIALGSAVGWSISPSMTRKTYLSLRQPPLRPPSWVFGPVWTVLYGLMGYGIHHAYTTSYHHPGFAATSALYTTQLGINLLWTPLFFGIERPEIALVDILALGANLAALTYNYFTIGDEVAGWTMVPYMAWISFATYLNVGVGVLNGWEITSKREAADKAK
ncbi:hypothetical protein H072_5209 [Dactylellina haptotyla CBS 200.50]|uniref:TspO/MBR-related protein n=1 Tax=Dactylellina haptotyla (strain CBS 200.50) TaxID=1284197 RepID=S8AIG0_DACHA|nr:hypothetical protein H072_5209 [Dactylellina haptotyla CBS 200.50]